MSIQTTVSSWEELLEIAQKNTPVRRVRRPGQTPSTAPIPSSLHKLPPDTALPVLLYRDTNSWCPFCERVWFALEEKEIPLRPARHECRCRYRLPCRRRSDLGIALLINALHTL